MGYHVTIKKSAEKELAKLPLNAILILKEKILALGTNPYPNGHKKLKGFPDRSPSGQTERSRDARPVVDGACRSEDPSSGRHSHRDI